MTKRYYGIGFRPHDSLHPIMNPFNVYGTGSPFWEVINIVEISFEASRYLWLNFHDPSYNPVNYLPGPGS